MNKKMKKAVTLLALSCILLGDREYASAKVYGNKATSGEYKSVSNKTSGGYDHHLYKNTVHGKKYYEKNYLRPLYIIAKIRGQTAWHILHLRVPQRRRQFSGQPMRLYRQRLVQILMCLKTLSVAVFQRGMENQVPEHIHFQKSPL